MCGAGTDTAGRWASYMARRKVLAVSVAVKKPPVVPYLYSPSSKPTPNALEASRTTPTQRLLRPSTALAYADDLQVTLSGLDELPKFYHCMTTYEEGSFAENSWGEKNERSTLG